MTTFRQKALGYYREADLRVLRAFTPEDAARPDFVIARIRGYQTTYEVQLKQGIWTCTCDMAPQPDCAHRAAVQLATGYRSTAERRTAR